MQPPLVPERKTPFLGDGDKRKQIPQLDTLASAGRCGSTAGRTSDTVRPIAFSTAEASFLMRSSMRARTTGFVAPLASGSRARLSAARGADRSALRRSDGTSSVIVLDSSIPVGIVKGRRTPSNCSMCWPARNARSARRPWSRRARGARSIWGALVKLAGAFRRVRARRGRSFQPRDGGRGLGSLRPVQPGERSVSNGRGAKSQR